MKKLTRYCFTAAGFTIIACCFFFIRKNGAYDGDSWWLLATGREIVENGIPYTNPFCTTEGLDIVVQQWLYCVFLWGLYSFGGFLGIEIYTVLTSIVIVISIYLMVDHLNEKLPEPYKILLTSFAVIGMSMYLSCRPMPISILLFLVVVLVNIKADKNPKWLFVLPLITIFHVNIHGAMWALDVFITLCFIKKTSIIERFLAILGMCGASLINPYGLNGSLYTLNSLGEASYKNAIGEMQPASIVAIIIMVGCVLIILRPSLKDRKKINLSFLFLCVGGLIATILSSRNCWIFSLSLALLASTQLKIDTADWKFFNKSFVSILILVVFIPTIYNLINAQFLNVPNEAKISSWKQGEEEIEPFVEILNQEDNPLIFSSYEINYHILEFYGIKVPFDVRPELYGEKISGSKDYTPFKDYIDAMENDEECLKYIEENKFNWFIVPKEKADLFKNKLNLEQVKETQHWALLKLQPLKPKHI